MPSSIDSKSALLKASAAATPYPLQRGPAEHARLAQQAQFWAADAAALFESASLAPGSRVADLGCGTLHVAQLMRRFVGSQGSVAALDSDPALVRDVHAEGIEPGLRLERGDAYDTGWRAGSLDAVHARFLAAPAGRLDVLVREMHRLVRLGGVVMLQEPIADSWQLPAAGEAWPRLRGLIRAGFEHRGGDFDVGRRLAQQLQSAGLGDVRTRCVAHRIASAHPYARLPLAFCDSLAARWRDAALASDDDVRTLRSAIERGLEQPGTTVTTFTLVQAWGRRCA